MIGAGPTGGAAPLLLALAASGATLAGGALGLRLARRLAPVLAVSAGVVLGVALFDLLPEALSLTGPEAGPRRALAWAAAGLATYMLVARAADAERARWGAHLAPAVLTLHSLVDGLGIGLAFHVSPQTGWLVALAVLTHDLADGVNVVGLCLAAGRPGAARGWLAANGFAPVAGAAIGMALRPPGAVLGPLLAAFAGSFLFIGAGELVPRSRALDPRVRTTLASVAGVAVMWAASGWAG